MKLSFRLSFPVVLLILALLILALVALSPGFVWSQTAPQGPSVSARGGFRMATSPAPSAEHRQQKQFSQPGCSFTFGTTDFPRQVASAASSANKAGHIVGGYDLN